jgi:hypothetical protein
VCAASEGCCSSSSRAFLGDTKKFKHRSESSLIGEEGRGGRGGEDSVDGQAGG